MKNDILLKKKTFFKFKNLCSFNKHILKFGFFGFKIKITLTILQTQEEFFRLFVLKNLKLLTSKKIKVFFFKNCFYSKTKLPSESRMGKGKGEIFDLFSYYKKGFILFELSETSFIVAFKLKKK